MSSSVVLPWIQQILPCLTMMALGLQSSSFPSTGQVGYISQGPYTISLE